MVVIQTSHGDVIPVALQFLALSDTPRCRESPPKTTVGPQLTLGTETIWRLPQRRQSGRTNRLDGRNLTK